MNAGFPPASRHRLLSISRLQPVTQHVLLRLAARGFRQLTEEDDFQANRRRPGGAVAMG